MNVEYTVCPYCFNSYKSTGISCHIKYCKENPNHLIHLGNKGNTLGRPAWNKGLTKETDNRVRQYSNTLHSKYVSGEIKSYWDGKSLPTEMREKIKNTMNSFFDEHGNPGWNHNHSVK